jgi:hypothetical protein
LSWYTIVSLDKTQEVKILERWQNVSHAVLRHLFFANALWNLPITLFDNAFLLKVHKKINKERREQRESQYLLAYIALHLAVLAALFVNYNPTYFQKVSFWEYP